MKLVEFSVTNFRSITKAHKIKLQDMTVLVGMDVITEGVETEQQLLSLSAMGCNHFQGYFFSRPIPVDEFEMKYSSVD